MFVSDRPSGRREDVDRTPPLFSKHTEIREVGGDITYTAEQFGLSEEEAFEAGPEYFKDIKGLAQLIA